MSDELDMAEACLDQFLAKVDPACTAAGDAASLVAAAASIERKAAAIKTLCAARMALSSVWKNAGHHSAAHWLAATSGTDLGEAARTLKTAEALGSLPLRLLAPPSPDHSPGL
jgi:hypothetical protein